MAHHIRRAHRRVRGGWLRCVVLGGDAGRLNVAPGWQTIPFLPANRAGAGLVNLSIAAGIAASLTYLVYDPRG